MTKEGGCHSDGCRKPGIGPGREGELLGSGLEAETQS